MKIRSNSRTYKSPAAKGDIKPEGSIVKSTGTKSDTSHNTSKHQVKNNAHCYCNKKLLYQAASQTSRKKMPCL